MLKRQNSNYYWRKRDSLMYEKLIKEIIDHNSECKLIYRNKENSLSDRWKAFIRLILISPSYITGYIQHYKFNNSTISWFDDFYYNKDQTVDNVDVIRHLFDHEECPELLELLRDNGYQDVLENIDAWPQRFKDLAEQMINSDHRWWNLDW